MTANAKIAVLLFFLARRAGWADDNMGMRIESVVEKDGVVTVVTTGAKFQIEPQGTVRFWQRIPRERELLRATLPRTPSPFRIERPEEFTVVVSYQSASWTIHGDSVAILKLNEALTVPFDTMIAPKYDALNRKGRRIAIDDYGGFNIAPVRPNTSNSRDPSGKLTYRFSRREEVWVAVFPPRPYNWQRSFEPVCHEGRLYAPYPSNAVIQSDGQYCKVFTLHAYCWQDDPEDAYDDYGHVLPRPHPWTSAVHIPADMAEFQRVRDEVHRNGMKFIVYVAPYYSRAPDPVGEFQRVLDEYEVDGFFADGFSHDFWTSYDIVRRTRQILGPDRVIYNHDTVARGYLDDLVYFPFLDAYMDGISRGEAGRQGLALADFLRWTVSGYNIGNAVGYWVYYGSNIDNVRDGPDCSVGGQECCDDGTQVCYLNRVPTESHIVSAIEKEVRIERFQQSWTEPGLEGELARFDKQYYSRLELIRQAWNATKAFSVNDRIQITASLEIRSDPSTSATLLGSQPPGAIGVIREGPLFADDFFWWNVTYENAPSGWSIQGSWETLQGQQQALARFESGFFHTSEIVPAALPTGLPQLFHDLVQRLFGRPDLGLGKSR